jgi:(1->4)-alpha-D-glucan 1-alpha-D-glucosylmutase
VNYLAELGATECYCSPLLAARPGSVHGYDICDHTRLNDELGSADDFEHFLEALTGHDLGLILDFVPNHMSADVEHNRWWRHVLENGPSSPFARFFDIDWNPFKPELKNKLLLPILADQYGQEIEQHHLRIVLSGDGFSLQYSDRNLPLNTRQTRILLQHRLDDLKAELLEKDQALQEFLSILFQMEHIPPYTETDPALVAELGREQEIAKGRLMRLLESSEPVCHHVEANIRLFNGDTGAPPSFDLLHSLLEAQVYRLSYWRTALQEINYRRFFDVNELAGLRMEDPEVFAATHALLLPLIDRGAVTGVRLDHVDGLFDPAGYFRRIIEAVGGAGHAACYLVAEKILSQGESLSNNWQVHGTTGYDFLNDLNGIFVDGRNAQKIKSHYQRFTRARELFSNIAYESKQLIITTSMAGELNVLAHELDRISEADWRYRDFTLNSLQEAVREVAASFPVYRTYVSREGWTEFDEHQINLAVARALRRNPAMEPSIFAFVRHMLLPTSGEGVSVEHFDERLHFAMKFQQFTGPVQAKGVEDTAFYRHAPLLSLNEVGGDPLRFGRSVEDFHRANRERLASWPLSMLATATHDTKRGEDARARLNVLSEIPEEYRAELTQWARLNASKRTVVQGQPAPDRHDEYFYYQALVGAWPQDASAPDSSFTRRLQEYMCKAIREAKIHTSWVNPNEPYDMAVAEYVKRTLLDKRFQAAFLPFVRRVASYGMVNSLAQVVLKIGAPGVADFYQGAELWDLNLVDPDNRRPVDFLTRRQMLLELAPLLEGSGDRRARVAALLEGWQDGQIKLYVTASALRLRRAMPALFLEGEYVPLAVEGAKQEHVVAFARRHATRMVVVIAPRLIVSLTAPTARLPVGTAIWQDTVVRAPEGRAFP